MCIFVLSQCSLAVYSFTSFFNSFVSSDKHATHTTHARHHQLENHIGHTQITEREIQREREREKDMSFCCSYSFVSSAVSSSARMKTTSRGGGEQQQHQKRLMMMKLMSKKMGRTRRLNCAMMMSSSKRDRTTTNKRRGDRGRRALLAPVSAILDNENSSTSFNNATSSGSGENNNKGGTTEKRRRKSRQKITNNPSINAFQQFFDVDANIITTEEEDDEDDEFEKTQLEIWGQLTKSLGKVLMFTFGVPYFASCSLQAMFVDPWLELKVSKHSSSGASMSGSYSSSSLTKTQTESVCNDIARFEKRLYYENLAQFPDEQDAAKFEKTKRKLVAEEMKRLEMKERTRSTKALGNWIGSMMYVSILACVLVYQKEFVSKMLTELSAQFNGLDSATQAFALMLGADMVVGYHSSDGWQAFLAFMITRYGGDYHKFETFARMFVATVPVFLDVCFKYWVFNKLRKISPSTQIILSEIERH